MQVELKLKWTKYCVLSTAGVDNVNNRYPNSMVFTMKETKLYVAVATLSAGDNHIGMNIKQKVVIKTRQMNLDILSNQVLLESIDYFL